MPHVRLRLERLEDRLALAADPILEWNAIALQANVVDHTMPGGTQLGPTRSAYALGIFSAATYDAVNSITGNYKGYCTRVTKAGGSSIDAAVAQAGRDILIALYPNQVATFNAALKNTLARVPDGPAEQRGIRVGHLAAAAILTARQGDGSTVMMNYTETDAPGHWHPDPLHPNQMALTPDWGQVRPFGLDPNNLMPAPPAPALDSAEYATAYNEVKTLGADGVHSPTSRTPEQTQIGIFWGYDGTPGLGTPPRLYNQIARTLAVQMRNNVIQNARMFALVNLAMADAGIASWKTKFDLDFWRPITAIRAGDADGNSLTEGDANWTPLGAPASNSTTGNFTPPFPAYTSGHATFGAALFTTLARFYGRDNIRFTIGSDEYNGITRDADGSVRPMAYRSYNSFSQAAQENAESRIYIGVHWRFDATQGILQGSKVANYLFDHMLRTKPIAVANTPASRLIAPSAPTTGDDLASLAAVLAANQGRRKEMNAPA